MVDSDSESQGSCAACIESEFWAQQRLQSSQESMSISIREPSHGPQLWAILGTPTARKQSDKKSLIQSSCLQWRLAYDLTTRQTYPFDNVSRTDQRSIVLDLHLKDLSANAVHDDLVATLGTKAVAHNTMTRYLREAKLGTAEVTLDPKPSSPHFDDPDRDILAALEEKTVFVRARICPSHPNPTRYRL
jgi:hypothetical protein